MGLIFGGGLGTPIKNKFLFWDTTKINFE